MTERLDAEGVRRLAKYHISGMIESFLSQGWSPQGVSEDEAALVRSEVQRQARLMYEKSGPR